MIWVEIAFNNFSLLHRSESCPHDTRLQRQICQRFHVQCTVLPTHIFAHLPVPTSTYLPTYPPGTDMQKGSPSNALHWITNQSDARQCKAKIRIANCNALRWSHSKGHLMASLSAARQPHGHCDADGHCEACRQPGPRRGVSLLTYPETCLVLIRGRVDDGKLLQNVK